MNNLYYIDVKLFDTFEGISSLIRKAVIASNEDEARHIIVNQLDREIEEIDAPCAGYDITNIKFVREL